MLRPSRPALRRVVPLAGLAAVVTLAACETERVVGTGSPEATMSATASTYLDEAVGFTRDVWFWTRDVNWTTARRDVRARANGAARPADTYDAIEYMIDSVLLPRGDRHSGFWRPDVAPGRSDSPASDARYLAQGQTLGVGTGTRQAAYLWMPTFSGRNEEGRADSINTVIRTLDAASPCGWIIDLRFNPGGNWPAMMAGLNGLLGDAPATGARPGFGGFVDRDGGRAWVYMANGTAGVFDPSANRTYPYVTATNLYRVRQAGLPIAVLQGRSTASAGELIILSLRGTSIPTRSFGDSTYGVTTVPYGTYLKPDSAFLNITGAIMFDRTGTQYGGTIRPDQAVAGPSARDLRATPSATDPVITAARSWLASRAECGGTATARGPELSRTPAEPGALPGTVKPLAMPADRISPYWWAPAALR